MSDSSVPSDGDVSSGQEETVSVGVVIPTYNRDELLRRALDSVIEQTRPPEQIVVVDGGSAFDVRERLSSYGDDVTVLVEEERRGAAHARNVGFEELETDYVAFLDSDDYWAPTKLEKQLDTAEAENAQLVYCDKWVVTEDGTKRPLDRELYDSDIWTHLLNGWMGPNTSTLLLDSATFATAGGFDAELKSCEDHDLWMRLARDDATFAYVPERLSYFTQEADNRISHTHTVRLPGVRRFLNKWRPILVSEGGRLHYYRFRWNYLMLVYGMIRKRIAAGEILPALWLYIRYLSLNPVFYGKAIRKAAGVLRHKANMS